MNECSSPVRLDEKELIKQTNSSNPNFFRVCVGKGPLNKV